MSSDFANITEILDQWLTSRLKDTVTLKEGKKATLHINGSLLKLENWLMKWKRSHELNERLDAAIISNSILRNISDIASEKAFNKKDYQFNFLYFLARNYTSDIELNALIDSFVDKFKEQFSFADIVITKTGATRCKTNIRFALFELRNMGMVLSKNLENKRTLSPSIPGLIAMLNIQYQTGRGNASIFEKKEGSLRPHQTINKYRGYPYDGSLYRSLQMFAVEEYMLEFLNWLSDLKSTEEEETLLAEIIDQYIDFTSKAVQITPKGLRFTKEFEKLSKAFQERLFEYHKRNIPFLNKLLNYFQGKPLTIN